MTDELLDKLGVIPSEHRRCMARCPAAGALPNCPLTSHLQILSFLVSQAHHQCGDTPACARAGVLGNGGGRSGSGSIAHATPT